MFSGAGWLCNLHFSPCDIERVKGKPKLKKGTIPIAPDSNQPNIEVDCMPNINHGQKDDLNHSSCNKCEALHAQIKEERHLQLKTRLNSEIEQYKKDKTIAKLSEKASQQSAEISVFKSRIANLEIALKQITLKAEQLQNNVLSSMNAEPNNERNREIVNCLVNGIIPTKKYPQNVRQFALCLHYHSPRAYEYLRNTFDNHLPHEATMRKWYLNSDINCKPGITSKSLEYLTKKVKEKKGLLVCSVCFDEMAIRKQIMWSHSLKKMLGYVSYGSDDVDDPLIAKEAIVFMVSGVNEKFRIPAAYHFVNSLDANKKSELVKAVLRELIKTGAKISSITFDGHPTNKKVCALLGANLNTFSELFQPYFVLDGQKIFLFYDVCHTEKLVRGQFDKKGTLFDENNHQVKWQYIMHLIKFSQERGFSHTHKLNQSHLEWRRRPMNVRIAVETLSKSTADSIEFLRSNGYKEFVDASATIRFILLFDRIFDVFNTKVPNENQNLLKRPLDPSNKDVVFNLFEDAISYIHNLSFREETGEKKKFADRKSKLVLLVPL